MAASTATVAPPAVAPAGRRPDPIPERARDVQLLGEFADSGYREAPTLVRRGDGQVIKLTPLLYELIDAIDGRRGHEELALDLGRRVGKQATADDVRFLIEHKLRPLGVLRQPDGTQPEVQRSNPLLAMRPRVIISRPDLTRALTVPFVWLFKPLVVAPVLAAFAALAAWLLFDKGLSSALHQAFYEPGLILVIWGLVLLATAFHEIGHATACRYGGARPGSIGAGLYVVWPAFYTEVTDAYRLSRVDRLRVDLGGLYFSAIFALVTAALWALTGIDALLLVIAVQLLLMVRQLAPFVRADGYHIVADLVGVPDLFAHIKPTLRGILPARWGGRRHKTLKPWARAVITTWVAITVPLLLLMLGFLVLVFPRLAATAWDSIGLRWTELTAYWGAGDVPGIAMTGISIGLDALPVLAITYFLSYLGRRLARRAWRDTAGRPSLRALALLGAAGLAAFLTWAWWPDERYRPIDSRETGPAPTILGPPPPEDPAQGFQLSSALTPLPTSTAPQPVSIIRAVHRQLRPQLLARAAPLREDPEGALPASERGSGESQEWPFPFDPPAPPAAGDNRALAINTTDGATLWALAFSLLVLDGGDPVDQANEAYALASCSRCVTGAVAFQVILIIGYVEEVLPINAAIALNYACDACRTYALAHQIVASVTEAPSPEMEAELEAAFAQLRALEAEIGLLTVLEVALVLEAVKQRILAAIEGILAVETAEAVASSPDAGAAGEGNGASSTEEPPGASVATQGADTWSEGWTPSLELEATATDGASPEVPASEPAAEGAATTPTACAEADTPEGECTQATESTEDAG